jgi:diguanylate cyclase (GGDEF)-like protein
MFAEQTVLPGKGATFQWKAFVQTEFGSEPPLTAPRTGTVLLAASVLAVVLVLIVVGLSLWQQRSDAWRTAVRSADNLRTVLSLEIANRFALIEIVLSEAAISVTDGAIPPAAQARILTRAAATERYIDSVLILGPAGDIVLDSHLPARHGNFADRDYFKVHVEQQDRGVFVGRPYRSRLRGDDPSIGFSRRLETENGAFGGVALAAFRLAYFRDLLASVDIGEGGILAINRVDSILLARHPPLLDDRDFGLDVSGSTNFQRVIRERFGTFTATAAIDGVERLYAFGSIEGTDLFLTVGLSVREIYAEWNLRALVIGAATLFICTLLVGQAVLLRRELGRRAAAEAALALLSMTDSLTGLPNRRCFDEFLAREWRRAGRTGANLSLLLIDADRFKELNDRFGHVLGDEVLRQLAAAIAGEIRRPGDLAARYGGEEFAVVLPDTDIVGARRVAETIRRRAANLAVGDGVKFTVSVGVASAVPRPDAPVGILIAQADAALYAAKSAGRDRVHDARSTPNADGPGPSNPLPV